MLSPASIQSTGNEISFMLTQLEEDDELDDRVSCCCCGSFTVIYKYRQHFEIFHLFCFAFQINWSARSQRHLVSETSVLCYAISSVWSTEWAGKWIGKNQALNLSLFSSRQKAFFLSFISFLSFSFPQKWHGRRRELEKNLNDFIKTAVWADRPSIGKVPAGTKREGRDDPEKGNETRRQVGINQTVSWGVGTYRSIDVSTSWKYLILFSRKKQRMRGQTSSNKVRQVDRYNKAKVKWPNTWPSPLISLTLNVFLFCRLASQPASQQAK